MAKRTSRITESLRQLGDIQVNEWDFMALLNKDIKDIEIGRSLRKLGERKVTDWEFKEVVPALQRFVSQDVDFIGWVKRTASIKVMEWDFHGPSPAPGVLVDPDEALVVPEEDLAMPESPPIASEADPVSAAEALEIPQGAQQDIPEVVLSSQDLLVIRLRKFLLFLAVNLVVNTDRVEVRVQQVERGVVRFRLVVAQSDLKSMLGRHGETAASMRSVLKGSAEAKGLYVLLEIVSVEEDLARADKATRRNRGSNR